MSKGVYCGADAHEKCRLGPKRCSCDCRRGAAAKPLATIEPPAVDIVWEDPPAKRSSRKTIEQILAVELAALRSRPGWWARIATGGTAVINSRAVRLRATCPDLEVVVRTIDGQTGLYARARELTP